MNMMQSNHSLLAPRQQTQKTYAEQPRNIEMQHVNPTAGRIGCRENASLRFGATLSRERHSRPIHYKAPHEINPEEHPRIINGVPYAVPLSRLEPYNDPIESKKKLEKKQRGGLGWNFGNHRARLQYVPTSGPFTPSNQKKFMSKRRRQRQNMTGKNGSSASLKPRIAQHAERKLEMWKQEREARRIKDVVYNRRGSITQRFSNKEKEKKWSNDYHPARVATKKSFGGEIWDWSGGKGNGPQRPKPSSNRKRNMPGESEIFLASNIALPSHNTLKPDLKYTQPASPRDLAEEFVQRANELAADILEKVDGTPKAESINPDLYHIDNYDSNTTGESGAYSPIKLGKDRLQHSTPTSTYTHHSGPSFNNKTVNHVGDNSVVEEGRKAIERLRMINAIEAPNDVINYELDTEWDEDELQELLNNNKPLQHFIKAISDTDNGQLMNEILRLQNINVKKMPIFDFISLVDCVKDVQYNVENLLLLLKALMCVDDFHHVSIMKIVYFIEKYGCNRKIDMAAKRKRKLSNVSRRRQSWVAKYVKPESSSENFVGTQMDGTENGRPSSGVQYSYSQTTSLSESAPSRPPPPPPPPIQ